MSNKEDFLFTLVSSRWLVIQNFNHLMEKNKQRIRDCGWYKIQHPSAITTLTFQICDNLEKSRSVKYIAVEILMRYLTIYFQQCEKCHTHDEILNLLNRNNRPSYLRVIFTSIRIADKFHSRKNHLTLSEIVHNLRKLGHFATYDQMNSLEQNMLVTIKFHVNFVIMPDYVENLLTNLKILYDINDTNFHRLKRKSVTLLDILYPHIEILYRQIYSGITKKKEVLEKDKKHYYQMKADYLSLALGVIAAAGYQFGAIIGAEIQSNLCLMLGAEEKVVAFYAKNIIQLYNTNN